MNGDTLKIYLFNPRATTKSNTNRMEVELKSKKKRESKTNTVIKGSKNRAMGTLIKTINISLNSEKDKRKL